MQYAFDRYVLDTDRHELIVGGEPVPVRPKVFALLSYLVENRARVVPKQELFDEIWQGVVVGDAALNTCIKAARQAVGDSGTDQLVIKTVHGHGYRFIAKAESVATPAKDFEIALPPAAVPPAAPPGRDGLPASLEPLPEMPSGKEHKHVTILDCAVNDNSGSFADYGDEVIDEIMERFIAIVNRVATRYDGVCARLRENGVVTLFGAPTAYEDHARRAVCAALDLQSAVTGTVWPIADGVSARAGLHTGPVIVGASGAMFTQIYVAAGEAMTVAEALQELAPPGSTVMSGDTYQLIRTEVGAELYDPDAAGGGGYLLGGLKTRRSGVPRPGGRRASPFIGRDLEMAVLVEKLNRLRQRGGEAIAIAGDPGIGKTRLVDELIASPDAEGFRTVRVNCLSYGKESPYLPVRRILREICGASYGDTPEEVARAVEELVAESGSAAPGAAQLLTRLIVDIDDNASIADLPPEEFRVRTFRLMHELIAYVAEASPLLLVVEDLQWVDPTSEAWLSELVSRLAGMPVLLTVTYRPGYRAPWIERSSATQLALQPLSRERSIELIQSIFGPKKLSAEAIGAAVEKGEGNPFFLEELAWALYEGRDHSDIPNTVQALLAARIDQLASGEKRLLQIAAVIGPVPPLRLLRTVAGEDDLERGLEKLEHREFLYPVQVGGEQCMAFRHTLMQEVASQSLIRRTRKEIHLRIANGLETGFGRLIDNNPELLAYHLSGSGDFMRAAETWRLAGKQAGERSADAEAVAHYRAALAEVEKLPVGPKRDTIELEILLLLGAALQIVEGPGAPSVSAIYERAEKFHDDIATARQNFEIRWGLWTNRQSRGLFGPAQTEAEELVAVAESDSDIEMRLQAYHARWTTARFVCELNAVFDHSSAGLAMQGQRSSRSRVYSFGGHDPFVCAHGARAIAHWLSGDIAESDREISTAVDLAYGLEHAGTLANALVNRVELDLMRRGVDALDDSARQLAVLADEYGLARSKAIASFALAWREGTRTGMNAVIDQLADAIGVMKDLGHIYQEPYYIALYAEALSACARHDEALENLAALSDGMGDINARHWAAGEVHRMMGDVLLLRSAQGGDEAEPLFEKALASARACGAGSLELRAAVSFARFLDNTGRRDEVLDVLRPLQPVLAGDADSPEIAAARLLIAGAKRK